MSDWVWLHKPPRSYPLGWVKRRCSLLCNSWLFLFVLLLDFFFFFLREGFSRKLAPFSRWMPQFARSCSASRTAQNLTAPEDSKLGESHLVGISAGSPPCAPPSLPVGFLLTQVNSGDTAVMGVPEASQGRAGDTAVVGVPEASQGRAGRSPEAVYHQSQADLAFYPNIPPLGISQAPSHQQDKADSLQSSLGNGVAYLPYSTQRSLPPSGHCGPHT